MQQHDAAGIASVKCSLLCGTQQSLAPPSAPQQLHAARTAVQHMPVVLRTASTGRPRLVVRDTPKACPGCVVIMRNSCQHVTGGCGCKQGSDCNVQFHKMERWPRPAPNRTIERGGKQQRRTRAKCETRHGMSVPEQSSAQGQRLAVYVHHRNVCIRAACYDSVARRDDA